ncbi:MAG: hypothetical protein ACXWP5_11875 [Bdellovibrionota bacterium]
MLVLSVTLGLWAERFCSEDARIRWEHDHPPDARVWRHALGSRGLQEAASPSEIQKLTRALPLRTDSRGSVWVTPGLEQVAVVDSRSGVDFQVFCAECKAAPKAWEPVGLGWEGFEGVLSRLDSIRKLAAKAPKKAEKLDPREIRY